MKTDFKFSNLLGTVYCQGNLLFSPDGTHLFSPVGNRVSVFNLVDNKSHTLPFAHRKNIARIGLSPAATFYSPLTRMDMPFSPMSTVASPSITSPSDRRSQRSHSPLPASTLP
ncbi:hypothetical protein V2G26_008246 [Clonostachys chloroleuca]